MNAGTPSQRGRDELFQLLADSLPLLVWISGVDKRCTYFNKAWLDFTGRPIGSAIGDGWADGVTGRICRSAWTRTAAPSTVVNRSSWNIAFDATTANTRWVLDNAAPLFNPDGSFAGYVGTCFDVTEFRRADAERNVANNRLRLAMESGKSVGWERDLKTNSETWFGDLSTIFGLPSNIYISPVEGFPRRWVHPEDQNLVEKAVEDALASRAPFAAEFRVVWPNGTVRWAAAKGQFHYSSGGEPERMLGMTVDITERKSAEEALVRKEVELKEAQRLAGVGSWQWDPATDTVVWSEELYRLAGRDPSCRP